MKTEPSLPTMHALALLPARERRHAAKLIGQSVASRTQHQAVEDIATAILLARSGNAVAPPAGTLVDIMDRVSRQDRRALVVKRVAAGLRWGGWGIAAALAIWMAVDRPDHREPTVAKTKAPAPTNGAPAVVVSNTVTPPPAAVETKHQLDAMKKELAALKSELQDLKSTTGSKKTLTVMQFRSPGDPDGIRPLSMSGRTLVSLLASSLQPYFAGTNGKSSTGPEIIIERGYGAFSADSLPEGYYFRHRRFPADEWEQLGLSQDDQGRFFDPYGNLIWSEDPDQPGTYVSSEPGPSDNLASFHQPRPQAPIAASGNQSPQTTQHPEVIGVIDPITNEGRILISGTDTLPPAPEGKVPVVWIGSKGSGGKQQWQAVGTIPTSGDPNLRPATNATTIPLSAKQIASLSTYASLHVSYEPTAIVFGQSGVSGGATFNTQIGSVAGHNPGVSATSITKAGNNTLSSSGGASIDSSSALALSGLSSPTSATTNLIAPPR